MILATTATAPVGRSIVEQLLEPGQKVRALTRDPGEADLVAGAQVVAGDLSDAESLRAAMEGVSAVFLLALVPGFAPPFLEAAKEAGVRRIVFQSSGAIVDGAEEQPNEVAAFLREINRAIEESGLERTFLRLDVASANALQWAFDVLLIRRRWPLSMWAIFSCETPHRLASCDWVRPRSCRSSRNICTRQHLSAELVD
jgi:uncharacterized protein YbjT (DUF2867 family)